MMRNLPNLSSFLKDTRGSAAEFALVLPILIIFLLGIFDVGYYAWQINRAEKAVQIGARWAVATDMVPSGLASYSFATSGGIEQGTRVPKSAFPGLTCTSSGCTCKGSCSFPTTADSAAFTSIVDRMQEIKSEIRASNVRIEYDWSGLGFSGDPNGPDVAPIVTVKLINMQHTPIYSLFTGTIALPEFAYSLTAEDSAGSYSN